MDERSGGAGLLFSIALLCSTAHAGGLERPWTEVRGATITVTTDAEQELALQVTRELEAFAAAFRTLAPGLRLEPVGPFRVIALAERSSWESLLGDDGPAERAAGVYLEREGASWLVLDLSQDPAQALRTARHELTHAVTAINLPRLPLWLAEGLAEYYATIEVRGSTVTIGRPVEAWRRRVLASGLDPTSLLQVAHGDREYADPARSASLYAGSWALVHWLFEGDAPPEAAGILVTRLTGGEDPLRGLEAALGLSAQEIEGRVRLHLTRLDSTRSPRTVTTLGDRPLRVGAISSAEAWGRLGELAGAAGRGAVAYELTSRARVAAPEDPATLARLAEALDAQARHGEAEPLWHDAVASGLADPRLLAVRSRRLLDRTESAAAAGLARRALRGGAFAEAELLLARSLLVDVERLDEALAAARRARELTPFRPRPVAVEAAVLGARGEREAARRLVEGVLAALDPDLVAAALEEVERRSLIRSAQDSLRAGDLESAVLSWDRAIDLTSDPALRESMVHTVAAWRHQVEQATP